jgi:uncharacterized protein with GYD domain
MPTFITYASYSPTGVKGLIAKPEDRSAIVGKLIEKAGAKMIAFYNTTGSNDVVVISEAPDGETGVAIGMAVASTGTLSRIETVRAWTGAEFVAISKKAGGLVGAFTPPGS